MATLSHRLEYLLVRAVAASAGVLTPSSADWLGVRLGRVAHGLMKSRRRIAEDNLRRALGAELGEGEVEAVVRRVFENLGRTMVEVAQLGKYSGDVIERIGTTEGQEHMASTYSMGKGVILATAHYGNWELAGGWLVAQGYPVDYLVGVQHNSLVDRFLVARRRRLGVGIIPAGAGTRGVFKALKANHFVAFACDQHASSGGITIDFFGRKASAAQGPAQFALRTGAPILPCGLRRARFDRHIFTAGPPILPPNSGDDEGDIRTMTEAYSRFFEDYIRTYPDQWMWTHRRWKLPE